MKALGRAEAQRASQGFEHLAQGRPAEALRIARTLAAEASDAPDAQHLLALALLACGEADAAIEAFERSLALAPAQPAILSNYARGLRRFGRRAEAAAVWRRMAAALPGDANARLEAGLADLEERDADAALAHLREAVRLAPTLPRAWHALGNALREVDALAEADDAFQRAIALDPGNATLWVNLGGVRRLRGRSDAALAAYAQARARGADDPPLREAEVGALIDTQQIDLALAHAESLVADHPGYVGGHTALAELRWEYGADAGTDRALASFREAATRRPDARDLSVSLISLLLDTGKAGEALERIGHLRREADDPTLMAMQANALEALGRRDEAARAYAEADRHLGDRDVHFVNAYVRHLLTSGDAAAAARRAEAALAIAPEHQETWAYLATAWRLTGDAREDWLCGFDRFVALMPIDVPRGFASMADFLAELRDALEALHRARNAPVRQSVRGGSQTPGRLFGRADARIVALESALTATVERFIARLPKDDAHPFLRRATRSVRYTGSWSVKLWRSGKHANHFHNQGWMSSAFYVALPPSVVAGSDAGALQLGQPPVELGLDLPPRRLLHPREGHLALFPSYLWHGTVPFDDEAPRLTVAFDMLPKA
jgi:tetratricopeptide (TPR) repeat protein